MAAGKLYESVAFDAPASTTDGFGGSSIVWQEHHACRAQWVYGKGDESVQAAREAGRKSYKIKVRSSIKTRAITEAYRMRDVRRGLPDGEGTDTLPGNRWNIRECDAITDRRWVYLVVEGTQSPAA